MADLSAARARVYLCEILVAGALVRVILWLGLGALPPRIWDARDYDALATTIARHGEFAFEPGRPISLRPPLYPAVVAGIYRVAGIGNYRAVALGQALMGLLIVVLTYGIGRLAYSRRVGVWAAGLVAFYPSLLTYNSLLLTEVQFTMLLCAVGFVAALAYRRRSLALLAPVGLLIGLASLTRSAMWPFPAVFGAFLLASWPGGPRRRLLAAAVVAVASAVTLAPWAIRNMRLERTFMTVDCMGGRNFMMGNYEHTPMFRAWDAISEQGPRAWYHVLAEADPKSATMTQGQKDKRALRYAVRFIAEHPGLTARRDVVKFFNFWGLERELVAGAARGYFGDLSRPAVLAVALLVVGAYVASMLSGIFGAVLTPPGDWRLHALLLLIIAFLTGLHTVTFGHSRYHLPLMPLVLLYSAAAVVHGRRIMGRRRSWSFALACLLCAVAVVGWTLEIAVVYRETVTDTLRGAG